MPHQSFSRALVTGASSGIGDAIARQLAAGGVDLVVVARSTDKLDALAAELPVDVEVLTADLTHPADLARVAARLTADPEIDLLVNNAGFGYSHTVASGDLDRDLAQVDIHIRAVLTLSHAAAGVMVDRGRGGILNVSSMAGFLPLPGSATYAAVKAFTTSFTESLHLELRGTGVHASVVCPGFVDTPMVSGDKQLSGLPNQVLLSADAVARDALRAVAANDPMTVPGLAWKAAAALSGTMPRSAIRLLLRGAQKLR